MFVFTVNPAMDAEKDQTDEQVFTCEKFHSIVESMTLVDFKFTFLGDDKEKLVVAPVDNKGEEKDACEADGKEITLKCEE